MLTLISRIASLVPSPMRRSHRLAVLFPLVMPGLAGAAALPGVEDGSAGSSVQECYRLAGEPYAPPAFKGVSIEAMDADQAVAACEAARSSDTRDSMLLNLTGRAYQARGDFDNARHFFELADKAGNPYAHANLAWFLIEAQAVPPTRRRASPCSPRRRRTAMCLPSIRWASSTARAGAG